MENTEQTNNKIQIGAKVDPAISEAVEFLAKSDERSISNTIERLLRSHPQVQEILESEPAGVPA